MIARIDAAASPATTTCLEGAWLAAPSGMKTRANRQDPGEQRRPSSRPDDGNAFLPDTVAEGGRLPAGDAESFAEEFIGSATQGEPVYETAHEEVSDDEEGGPFIVLDDEGRLPPEPDEPERESSEAEAAVEEREQAVRGAIWAARGV